MKVLVTGGAGFIGSHVAELLLANNHQVTIIDDLSQGKPENVPKDARFIEDDILDYDLVRDVVRDQDWVCHLAAMSRVFPSLEAGARGTIHSADQNIIGTLNVLAACVEAKIKKFIYSASSTYYGNLPVPHREDAPEDCQTPYAISKYAGELYALQFDRMYGLPVLCLRYFQVYGPREPISGAYAMVRGIFLEQARQGLLLTIHGDGSQRRDFVHVKDVAKANLLALESPLHGEVINVGTGRSVSIKELADRISPNQVFQSSRAHDMKETLADVSKCQQVFGWVPQRKLEDHIHELSSN
jgi:UDP-glucose 4-epimerase